MSKIGDRIKTLRKTESLTQKEFAKRLLVSQSYLSGIENNNEMPTSKLIKIICLEFGVSEDWLVNNHGEMYDEVYENNKAILADISNSALLKFMNLLTTESNTEYGFYAYTLSGIVDILETASLLDERKRLIYLELIQNFILDLQRAILISNRIDAEQVINHHQQAIRSNIDKVFQLLLLENHEQSN